MRGHRNEGGRLTLAAVALLLTIAGCSTTSMVVAPSMDVLSSGDGFRLRGQLEFDGNRDYLPRTIADTPSPSGLTFRYAYAVTTDSERTSIFGLMFAPAPVLGIPGVMGGDELGAVAQLEIRRRGDAKTYAATAVVKKKPTMFDEGQTFTEMRRRALIAVRDSIEAQMIRDREILLRFGAD